jgi:hypothetical protein
VMADRFNEVSKANQGFGGTAVMVMEKVGRALAFVGDMIRVLQLGFKAGQIAFMSLVAAMGSGVERIVTIVGSMVDYVTENLNVIIRGLNSLGATIPEIPSLSDSGFVKSIQRDAEEIRESVGNLIREFQELANEPLPSDKFEQFMADVKRATDEMAQAALDALPGGGGGEVMNEEVEARKKALADQLKTVEEYGLSEHALLDKQLQARMELVREAVALRVLEESKGQALVAQIAQQYVKDDQAIDEERIKRAEEMQALKSEAALREYEEARAFALSDEEAEIEEYERAAARVLKAIDDEIVTKEEGYARLEEMERAHLDRLIGIREAGMNTLTGFTKASFAAQTKHVIGQMVNMTAGVARENRAMFEANKAAGIANAVISAYEGISLTLSKYPYPLSIAMAALQGAAAFAQVKAIASQSFSKGGAAAPSLAGGTPATPVTPVTGGTPQSASRLIVEGIDPSALFSGRAVRELMERIAEHQRDGGTVVFG